MSSGPAYSAAVAPSAGTAATAKVSVLRPSIRSSAALLPPCAQDGHGLLACHMHVDA